MKPLEPTNLFYYGSIIVMLLVFAFVDYYFFRNTIKEKNVRMFIYVGVIALVIGGLFIYTTWL